MGAFSLIVVINLLNRCYFMDESATFLDQVLGRTSQSSQHQHQTQFPDEDLVDTYLNDYDPFRPEIVITEKGARALCYGGYIYSLNKATNMSLYWVCREHNIGCMGKVRSSVALGDIRDISHHNHAPSPSEIREVKAKAAIKQKASEAYKPKPKVKKIVEREITAEVTPVLTTIGENLMFIDPTIEDFPIEPKVLEELDIDGPWANTKGANTKRFLLYDNRSLGLKRLIVFATDEHLGYLATKTKIYVDLSPSLAPAVFKQLIIVQAEMGADVVPLVYAFASGDEPDIYEELFTVILSKCEDLSLRLEPTEFVMGYNVNCLDAVKTLFGAKIHHYGRFYHLSQFVWHSIQGLDLTGLCQDSETFRLICCELVALAFLPIDQVWHGMGSIKETMASEFESSSNNETVKELIEMFDTLFVTGKVTGTQKLNGNLEVHQLPPIYPIESWNLFNKVLTDDPSVNNILESCGSNFSFVTLSTKPPVFKAISYLQQEQQLVSEKIASYNEGAIPQKRVKKNLVSGHEKLAQLCSHYMNGEFSRQVFLVSVARNIRIGDW